MNKLLLIITLFVSSFFIFHEDVKAADPFEVTFSDDSFDLINEEFFNIRNKVISIANLNSYHYLIFKLDNNYAVFYHENSVITSTGRSWFEFPSLKFSYELYELDGTLSSSNSSVNLTKSSNDLANLLDSTFDIYYSPYSLNITYRGYSYVVDSTTKLKTIFDLYLENGGIIPNPHQEEIDKLTNFYTMIVEKLSYLAESFVSNYIFLSIIVIFILIFIFKLIFGRFL